MTIGTKRKTTLDEQRLVDHFADAQHPPELIRSQIAQMGDLITDEEVRAGETPFLFPEIPFKSRE